MADYPSGRQLFYAPIENRLQNRLRPRIRLKTFGVVFVFTTAALFSLKVLARGAQEDSNPQPAGKSAGAITADYNSLKQEIQNELGALRSAYLAPHAPQTQLLAAASSRLGDYLYNQLMPYWYGTAWSFEGTTAVPRSGFIACGYFVSTVLEQAGFKLDRFKMAQVASEILIKSLVSEEHILRFSSAPLAGLLQAVRAAGQGLYLVGLDNHTGFIVYDGKEVYLVHSSYTRRQVVREKAASSRVLKDTRYLVLGCLSADAGLIEKWILGRPITMYLEQ